MTPVQQLVGRSSGLNSDTFHVLHGVEDLQQLRARPMLFLLTRIAECPGVLA